ncbi:MAG: hypothetical protein OEY11_02820 [Gammaproteobacteria bacterium]|nr:hypothetical protein [Gammaproteobacteria bacterium]
MKYISILLITLTLTSCVNKTSQHNTAEAHYRSTAERELNRHTIRKDTFLGLELLHEFNESELNIIEDRRKDAVTGGQVLTYKDSTFDAISLYITDYKVSKTFAFKKFKLEYDADSFMDLLISKSQKSYPKDIFNYITSDNGYRQLGFNCINSIEEWKSNYISNMQLKAKGLPAINQNVAYHPIIHSYTIVKLNRDDHWVVSIDLTTSLYEKHKIENPKLDGANINDI